MKRKLLYLILLVLCTNSYNATAQIFSQDFGDATNNAVDASAYATTTNSTKRMFNFISNYGNTKSSIVDGKLQFNKTAASTSHFVRNLDFAPVPKFIKVSFKFQCIDAVGDANLNHAAFMFGSGFVNDATLPSQADTHSKFGITMSGGDFKLNVISNVANTTVSQSSSLFSGQKAITFVANNTGTTQGYLAPDGSNESVANDTWDLWIDNTKVYNDIAAYGNADIKNFRFSMLSANATINTVKVQFDDIEIYNLSDFLAWDFSGQVATLTGNATPTIHQANLQSSVLSRGAGLAEGSFNNSYFSTVAPVDPLVTTIATKADAITNNIFYTFSVKAKSAYIASLTTLNSKVRRNTTGPKKIQWQYSTNGTVFTDLGTEIDLSATSDGDVQVPIDLSGISALQNVTSTTTITFRLLGWDATAGGGFAIGRITSNAAGNSLFLDGRVENASVLPVTISTFKATKQNNSVRLNWATASEKDNSYFNILRAGDDKKFIAIGKINGNGTTSVAKEYSLTDYKPLAGANYYKLTQTDLNGDVKELGDVQHVQFDLSKTSLTVIQNADKTTVKALLNARKTENATVAIYNVSGSHLHQAALVLNKGLNEIEVPINLNKGVYILQVKTQSGEALQAKFVKLKNSH